MSVASDHLPVSYYVVNCFNPVVAHIVGVSQLGKMVFVAPLQ